MSENYNALTDGTYVFQKGEEEDQFFFFRKDGGEINRDEAEPIELYQAYMCRQMFDSDNPQMVMSNLKFETSTDNKCIRITVMDLAKQPLEETKKMGLIARLKGGHKRKNKGE